jgi:beta-lactamase superfamily II metal-dependent hydrolase
VGQMEAPPSGVTVRMYRTGFGDCFLLAFRGDSGEPVTMLIDCGAHSQHPDGKEQIPKIVSNIRESTRDHLAVLAITHEHADHISGFAKCQDEFAKIQVDDVWFAWTENPGDQAVKELKERRRRMFTALQAAEKKFTGLDETARGNIRRLLEFFDGIGMTGSETMNFVRNLVAKPRYLKPKTRPLSIPGVRGVRVFVLGPPEEREYLLSPNPSSEPGQVYTEMGLASAMLAAAGSDSADAEPAQPFAANYRIVADAVREKSNRNEFAFFHQHYGFGEKDENSWRRIDVDWQYAAESLALKLDSATNNTSLVLAIELPNTKRVLLFPGDAQVGNWESWHKGGWSEENGLAKGEKITAADLLARTVLYKVGHHGSHNATLRRKGLELMTSHELVAMIPVDQKWAEARKPTPWKMPFHSLYEDLTKRARRIYRTDELNPEDLYVEHTVEDR